jgi:hypothetical protein
MARLAGRAPWESPDGDFRLACTHDRLGRVSCAVRLGDARTAQANRDDEAAWELTAVVALDPGALEALAHDVERFMRPAERPGWSARRR